MPVSDAEWGLPTELSVTVMEPVRAPMASGVKVTVMVQLPEAATVAPQVVVRAKSPAFVPVTAIPDMVSEPEPGFFNVNVFAELVVFVT